MKTKLIYTLAAALFAFAPMVRANGNQDSTVTVVAHDDDQQDRDRDRAERERDRAEAKADKEEDLYDSANDALDDHDWRRAAASFRKVADMHMAHADAALYWLAYAQGKMGARSEALSTL